MDTSLTDFNTRCTTVTLVRRLPAEKVYDAAKRDFDTAKKLVDVVQKAIPTARPAIVCAEPEVLRELKIDLKTGNVIK